MIDAAKDELIPLADVADRFRVTSHTVRKWRDDGRLEAVRVGGRWYTTAAAINRFAVLSSAAEKAVATQSASDVDREAIERLRKLGVGCNGPKRSKRESRPQSA